MTDGDRLASFGRERSHPSPPSGNVGRRRPDGDHGIPAQILTDRPARTAIKAIGEGFGLTALGGSNRANGRVSTADRTRGGPQPRDAAGASDVVLGRSLGHQRAGFMPANGQLHGRHWAAPTVSSGTPATWAISWPSWASLWRWTPRGHSSRRESRSHYPPSGQGWKIGPSRMNCPAIASTRPACPTACSQASGRCPRRAAGRLAPGRRQTTAASVRPGALCGLEDDRAAGDPGRRSLSRGRRARTSHCTCSSLTWLTFRGRRLRRGVDLGLCPGRGWDLRTKGCS